MRVRRFGAAIVAAVLAVTACSPAPADPRQLLVDALAHTGSLSSAHVILVVRVDTGTAPIGTAEQMTLTIEGDVDLVARELAVSGRIEPALFGSSRIELVVADHMLYSRTDGGAWSSSGDGTSDPLELLPTTAEIAAAFQAAARDPHTVVERLDSQDCGDARCHRVRAVVPPEVIWQVLQAFVPTTGPAATTPPVPEDLAAVAIDVLIGEDDGRLEVAVNTTTISGQTISISIDLSNHGEPVSIEPPDDIQAPATPAPMPTAAGAYTCGEIWDPDTASDGDVLVQRDMGMQHLAIGDPGEYALCPPASGPHYNGPGAGPIEALVYGPDDPVVPMGWIHNLEHGALVLLYRCPGEPCTDGGMKPGIADLRMDWPDSPVCGTPAGVQSPVFARFDDMAWPYAALVWGHVLPLESLDRDAILAFYAEYGDRTNPERLCAVPTPAP